MPAENVSVPKTFPFLTFLEEEGGLPLKGPRLGMAFPRGGTHAAWQAGVIHAFVTSGVLPHKLVGNSMGAVSATAMAIARSLDSQDERMRFVSDYLTLWLSNPSRRVYEDVTRAPGVQDLLKDLAAIDVPLADIVSDLDALRGKKLLRKLVLKLMWQRPRSTATILCGLPRLALGENVSDVVVKGLLRAYRMKDSVIKTRPVDAGFINLFSSFVEKETPTFGDLSGTELRMFAASRRNLVTEDTRKLQKHWGTIELGDQKTDRLFASLQATTAAVPICPPVSMDKISSEREADVLFDATFIDRIDTSTIIQMWKDEQQEGDSDSDYWLFSVYNDPIGGSTADDSSGFFAEELRSLYLLRQRDQLQSHRDTRVITELLKQWDADEGPGASRESGYLKVCPIPVAPKKIRRMMALTVPTTEELREQISDGCKTGLATLHSELLTALAAGSESVSCSELMVECRKRYGSEGGFFQPSPQACAGCDQRVPAPALRKEPEVPDEPPRPLGLRKPEGKEQGVQIMVAQGGVFLGIFQVGALAALRETNTRVDLYAGASVGTLFSLLLSATLEGTDDRMLARLVQAMMHVPQWADQTEPGKIEAALEGKARRGPGNRFHDLSSKLKARLREPRVKRMLELTPGALVRSLQPTAQATSDRQVALDGLCAMLFPKRTPARQEQLWGDLRRFGAGVMTGRLEETLLLLDEVVAGLGIETEVKHFGGQPFELSPEFIGFTGVESVMRALGFEDADLNPDWGEGEKKGAHFLFPVTNHSTGEVEYFGGPPDTAPSFSTQPDALKSALAGSSFPLAFRRRYAFEVYDPLPGEDGAGDEYADGGIFNNFPADTALKYLRYLSQFEQYRWVAQNPANITMMSLEFPEPRLEPGRQRDGYTLYKLSSRNAYDAKQREVLKRQRIIRRLIQMRRDREAELPAGKQAIDAQFLLIAPARKVIPNSLTFLPELGFKPEHPPEMLAAGCRRTRYALRFRAEQEGARSSDPFNALRQFDRRVRATIRRQKRKRHVRRGSPCVLGEHATEDAGCVTCPFVAGKMENARAIYKSCYKNALRDLTPDELPPTSRISFWDELGTD